MLQSYTQIYRVVTIACKKVHKINNEGSFILKGMSILTKSMEGAESFSDFVQSAVHFGVLSAQDAEVVVHTFESHSQAGLSILGDAHMGIHCKELESYAQYASPDNDNKDKDVKSKSAKLKQDDDTFEIPPQEALGIQHYTDNELLPSYEDDPIIIGI